MSHADSSEGKDDSYFEYYKCGMSWPENFFSLANKKYQNVLREVTALGSIMENEEGP